MMHDLNSKMLKCLKQFGKSDDLYKLLEEYPIRPWESWTIEEKIIHAPGGYVGRLLQG